MENQVLEGRYVKKHRLNDLLQRLFPTGNYTVEVCWKRLVSLEMAKKEVGERWKLCFDSSASNNEGALMVSITPHSFTDILPGRDQIACIRLAGQHVAEPQVCFDPFPRDSPVLSLISSQPDYSLTPRPSKL